MKLEELKNELFAAMQTDSRENGINLFNYYSTLIQDVSVEFIKGISMEELKEVSKPDYYLLKRLIFNLPELNFSNGVVKKIRYIENL